MKRFGKGCLMAIGGLVVVCTVLGMLGILFRSGGTASMPLPLHHLLSTPLTSTRRKHSMTLSSPCKRSSLQKTKRELLCE
jgi:hypothetical protein